MKNKFTTRDLVIVAILIAIGGVFQVLWAHLLFQIKILGPFSSLFTNVGFMVWGYIALYFVRKPGAATLVKGLGAVIEVLLGNPVGPIAIAYGTLEGVAVDLSFLLFRKKLSINMMIIGALFSQIINGPIDVIRDAVPITFMAIATYFAPGIAGTVFTGWFSSVIINAIRKIGLNSPYENKELK
jgi:ABC-type thiamin/hydroxymethylpyrimidine transport system permease subunit